jgi:(p)ppGpp synthase/HD superfamily hydrolase
MSKLVEQALNMAAEGHAKQTRKYDGKQYMNHINEVLALLKMANVSEPTLLAGILHDALEDTLITHQDIELNFGSSVLDMVMLLTDNKKLPLERRHQLACQKALIMDGNIINVKLADLISNMTALPHSWQPQQKNDYLHRCRQVLEAISLNPKERSIELEDLAKFVYTIVSEGTSLYHTICNWAEKGRLYWSAEDCCLLHLPDVELIRNIQQGTKLEARFNKLFNARVLRSLELTDEDNIEIRETRYLDKELSIVQRRYAVDHLNCVRVQIAF